MGRLSQMKLLAGVAVIVALIVVISVIKPVKAAIEEEEVRAFVGEQFAGTIDSFKQVERNGKGLYELELIDEMGVYEITIDQYTGDILALSHLGDHKKNEPEGKKDNPPTVSTLSLEEMKEHVESSLGEEITILEHELDKEEGRLIYDVKVRQSEGIAEIKIDAKTGEVLVYKLEEKEQPGQNKENTSSTNPNAATIITKEEAKQIALTHVDGKLEDIDFEEEDGRLVYKVEIEVEAENIEVEIVIDAVTGEVVTMIWED